MGLPGAQMQGGSVSAIVDCTMEASISWCAVTGASQPLLWSCRELDVPELESLLSKIAQRIRLGLTAFRAVRIFCSPLASAPSSACGA